MIVEIDRLSKKYLIQHEKHNPYASLKEILSDWVKGCFRRTSPDSGPSCREFWALKDIHLSIQEGDRVALLGRNGAGKSTLLKVLSRITEPTTGTIKMRGRVASLLEVGTGFHPDLSGRENIFLNGAIMGMSYREMKRKFDEIVAFADIETFLDTPIKRYSSGMFMRLGFAVAAHLDADLLIVDEVLAVGDAQFQDKCLKKMNEIGSKGSTVIFVSHSLNAVLSLCNKGIFLEKGTVKAFEPIEQCISRYMRSCPAAGLTWQGEVGDDYIQIYQAALSAPRSNTDFFYQGEETVLCIDFEVVKPHADLVLGFSVLNSRSQVIARSRLSDHEEYRALLTKAGSHRIAFQLDSSLFHPGEYYIQLECSLLNQKKIIQDDVLLKFAIYSMRKALKYEIGCEKEGISLGDRWLCS